MQSHYNNEHSTYISFVLLMFPSGKLTIQKSIPPYWCYCRYPGQMLGKLNTKLNWWIVNIHEGSFKCKFAKNCWVVKLLNTKKKC